MMNKIITSADQIDFSVSDLPLMPVPGNVLMVEPTYFNVEYVINPHMEGHVGGVDRSEALRQWKRLKTGFEAAGLEVDILKGKEGLPDMVFCANQSLPFCDRNGTKKAIMGRMYAPQRRGEVKHIKQWYQKKGYQTLNLDPEGDDFFEGMGDALWHPKRKLLWGAYGFRSSKKVYRQIAALLDTPVIILELTDETFYHLDTCMCMLDEHTVLIYPGAFTEEGLAVIHALFDNVITSPRDEAVTCFAVNATCPDGNHVLIQQGCTQVVRKLRKAGFEVLEFDTGEFIKSGGSVFCMKLLYW